MDRPTSSRSEQDAPTLFFADGRQLIASQDVRRNTFNGELFLRFGLPFDSQLEVDIPYRYVEQQVVTEVGFGALAETESHGSGFGDLGFGLAKGLLHERNWWPDLIARVTWDTDSGETSARTIPAMVIRPPSSNAVKDRQGRDRK